MSCPRWCPPTTGGHLCVHLVNACARDSVSLFTRLPLCASACRTIYSQAYSRAVITFLSHLTKLLTANSSGSAARLRGPLLHSLAGSMDSAKLARASDQSRNRKRNPHKRMCDRIWSLVMLLVTFSMSNAWCQSWSLALDINKYFKLHLFDIQNQEAGQQVYFDAAPVSIRETWEALEDCVHAGLCKRIGVSNFSIAQIQEILSVCRIKPVWFSLK